MDLHFYQSDPGNFGDDLNQWLWDDLLPGWREIRPDALLVGVGTLINDNLPRDRPKIILGSGLGYGPMPAADLLSECRFVAVRGPRSEAALGLPAGTEIIDPAVMIPELPGFQDIARGGRAVFVPHHSSLGLCDWESVCDLAGVDYVSPAGEARAVIHRLAAAPLVLAESMHAAIIADAFGTPWQGVRASPRFLESKWRDWADSLGLVPQIAPLFPITAALGRLVPRTPPPAVPPAARPRRAESDAPVPPPSLRKRVRARLATLELGLASRRLAALSRRKGQLSDRATLAARRDTLRARLAVLAAEGGQ